MIRNYVNPKFAVRRFSTRPQLNFNEYAKAYKTKTNYELIRALIVFRISSTKLLVQNAQKLIDNSKKVFGSTIPNYIVRHTFFDHFCAGENEKDLTPTLKRLQEVNIGAILDYAAEKDVPQEQAGATEVQDRKGVVEVTGRIHDYEGEDICDNNLKLTLDCIDTASRNPKDGIIACKLTGLGKPSLLLRVSNILLGVRRMWIAGFTQEKFESIPEEELRLAVEKPENRPNVTMEAFHEGLSRVGVNMSRDQTSKLFKFLDQTGKGSIDYLDWTARLHLLQMAEAPPNDEMGILLHTCVSQLAAKCGINLLNDVEVQLTSNLLGRLRKISQSACDNNVRLLVDAEQTYLQVAIDHFTLQMQREYNKSKAVVFNTYQCYLNFARNRVINDLQRCRREGWWFAAKLVRGAYMVQERRLSQEKHYQSPIHNTIQETHNDYNQCIKLILEKHQYSELVIATHNQESIETAVKIMIDHNIPPNRSGVYFAQLLGMADHLSLTLGSSGYNAYKYVPYGPLDEVMPYLIRRAQENGDIMAGAQKERVMMRNELKRRVFG
eukprot:NODE_1557_length_1906_cov_42.652832_g1318_i0.p1 GENE.NODE_1557_length_1906_cov_42.652832_g1318_i0~~NODE_1557_length_1906_cov_42.652832_g1318_i0.p1  ORF type:complete len:551 (-),score=111.42 NODE_1557_length_1906_cov_42.652832_g1318_i0:187-1839(-)